MDKDFYLFCKDFLKKDEVISEIKEIVKPFITLILQELYPYIYISILLVLISFFLLLGIFILLLRNKNLFR